MTTIVDRNTVVNLPNQPLTRYFNLERRRGHQAAILMLNLDLNDLDRIADELLNQIAHRVHQRLRDSDVVVQLDGNEFVILLKDIHSPDNADNVANELIAAIAQPFELKTNMSVQIDPNANIRVGISFFPQEDDQCH